MPSGTRYNRHFLRRSARFLAETGIRQFIDLGSGIPTVGNVHEVVQAVDSECRVVYVDQEWVAVKHAELLLSDQRNVAIAQEDMRDAARVLGSAPVNELLDLSKPVAVLMYAVLHFVADSDNPAGIVAAYRDATVPGSYLAMSHGTIDHDPDRLADAAKLYQQSTTPVYVRTREQVLDFFDGYEVLDPGVVYSPQWRPEDPEDVPERPELAAIHAAVGRRL